MFLLLDSGHLVHQLWHFANAKNKREGRPDGEVDPDDVLDWYLIKLDHLREYTNSLRGRMVERGYMTADIHLIAAFDSAKSNRQKIVEDYKGHREKKADSLYVALNEAPRALEYSSEWTAVTAPDGWECDDAIATLAYRAQLAGHRSIIHSIDKDFNQCLVPGMVSIIKESRAEPAELNDFGIPIRDELKVRTYTAQDYLEEWGFPIDRWVDYQAMVGDSADNIQGCVGVGPKTAKAILQEWPTTPLEAIPLVKILDQLNKRQAANWPAFIDRINELRFLLTLRTNLEIGADLLCLD